MKKLVLLVVLFGCSAENKAPSLFQQLNQAPNKEVQVSFANPAFPIAGYSPGGGIVGDPVTLVLPQGTSSFYLRLDGGLHVAQAGVDMMNAGTFDSNYYNLRLPAVIVATVQGTNFTVYPLDPTTNQYHVPSQSVELYPVWQMSVDWSRDIAPNVMLTTAHAAF